MAYTPVKMDQFGGLNVNSDPAEVGGGGAIDIQNIDPLQLPEQIVPRQGMTSFTGSDPIATGGANFWPVSWDGGGGFGEDVLAQFYNSGTGALELHGYVSGASVVIETLPGCTPGATQAWGGPGVARVYALCEQPHYYDFGTGLMVDMAFAAPFASYATVSPLDNRLVAGNLRGDYPAGGSAWYDSRVRFSNARDADTWSVNDYVDLEPGNAGAIEALCTWQNDVYALKTNGSLYRFYGNSTDAAGNPIFNFKTIQNNLGYATDMCAAPDGIYIASTSGIFRSQGGPAVSVSAPVDPLISGEGSSYGFQGITVTGIPRIVYADNRVYVFYADADLGLLRALVYAPRTKQWSYYDLSTPAAFDVNGEVAVGRLSGAQGASFGRWFPAIGGQVQIYALGIGTTDAGTAIDGTYRTGWYDLGTGTENKTIRETLVEGTGAVTYTYGDDWKALSGTKALTLGSHPTPGGARARLAHRGRFFSHQFSGTNTSWSVDRLTHHVREKRAPALTNSDA